MLTAPDVMRMAQAMATHASQRHEVIAKNIAHADTPGYRAQDVMSFADSYSDPDLRLRQTRGGHLGGDSGTLPPLMDAPGRQSPNGNTVSLEVEMMKAGEVRQDHNTALAIYRNALDILRVSIGRA